MINSNDATKLFCLVIGISVLALIAVLTLFWGNSKEPRVRDHE